MKIITTQQLLSISGGCQKAVNKYEAHAGFYSFVGTVAGAVIGYTSQDRLPEKILMGIVGQFFGAQLGYIAGATGYWVDRAFHKTTDAVAKPYL